MCDILIFFAWDYPKSNYHLKLKSLHSFLSLFLWPQETLFEGYRGGVIYNISPRLTDKFLQIKRAQSCACCGSFFSITDKYAVNGLCNLTGRSSKYKKSNFKIQISQTTKPNPSQNHWLMYFLYQSCACCGSLFSITDKYAVDGLCNMRYCWSRGIKKAV